MKSVFSEETQDILSIIKEDGQFNRAGYLIVDDEYRGLILNHLTALVEDWEEGAVGIEAEILAILTAAKTGVGDEYFKTVVEALEDRDSSDDFMFKVRAVAERFDQKFKARIAHFGECGPE